MAIDSRAFKDVMSHWATGVTVVTTRLADQPVGITANSFASVSLEPPQILVCVSRKLHTHQAIEASGIFAVNILGVEHLEWGMRFAGMRPELENRFAEIEWFTAHTGAPLLSGVLGWLDCEVRQAYDGGDHSIFVGRVMASGARTEGWPLLYFNRHWRQVAETPLQLPQG
jgi:flavin reductase